MTLPYWRTAAASCLLAAGMIVTTGGAPALADTGADATDGATAATTSGGPVGTTQQSSIDRVNQALRTTLDEVTTTVGAGRQRLTESLAGQTGTARDSSLAAMSSGLAATTRITRTVTGVLDATPTRTPTDDVDGLATPIPTGIAPAAAVPDAASPVIGAFASTADKLSSIPASATTTALTTVTSLVDPVTNQVTITSLTAPIPDVIASLQELLTTTTDAFTPLTALPSDLASLFAVAGTSPTSPRVGSGGPWTASVAAPPQLIQLLTGTPDGVRTDANVVPTPTIDLTAALGRAASASTSARVAPDGVVPGGIQAFFGSRGGLIAIVAVSLSALAAAALPGIAGLLASAAAGVRLGYRQAKAQMAIRASGIARFAVGGPVGVVRSGNLVSLRPRTARVARPNAGGLSRNVA